MLRNNKQSQILSKIAEWLKRYLPAEIIAVIGAMIGGLLAHYFFSNPVITALGGTWGENIGYYSKIIFDDLKKRRLRDGEITISGVFKLIRNVAIEFGPSEYFDSFIIRPAAMYFFSGATGSVPLGLLLGKISADVTFYLPTIFAYELRKKYIKD